MAGRKRKLQVGRAFNLSLMVRAKRRLNMQFHPLQDCVVVRRVDAEKRCRQWTTEVSEARERAQPRPCAY
jgi:hypothetical protein